MHRAWLSVFLCLVAEDIVLAQAKIANPGFEQGEVGSIPANWIVPSVVTDAGFTSKTVDQECHSGARCAMLTGVSNPPANAFGNLIQALPAGGYLHRRIRLRAAIRVTQSSSGGSPTRAQMWLRLDRADHTVAFLENMNGRPVTSPLWKTYDIETDVPGDVSQLVFGVMLFGAGSAWVDDVSLDVLSEIHKDKIEPPRPLTSQGLINLTAFSRLYGYVRFFHPSDQAGRAKVRPVGLDVLQAGRPARGAVRGRPAGRHRRERRPQRMLALGVDQDVEAAALVIERVGRHEVPVSLDLLPAT